MALTQVLKELEWVLPVWLQRPLLRSLGDQYNPYSEWNRQHRSIFIHIPRTGGSSVAAALGISPFHYPLSRYFVFDEVAGRTYFKFAFVRNPWDRLLSAFSYLFQMREKSGAFPDAIWCRSHLAAFGNFQRFVLHGLGGSTQGAIMRYPHFRRQTDWLIVSGRIDLEFIGRFENLQSEFDNLAKRLPGCKLPHLRPTVHVDYRAAYTAEMQAIVSNLYQADIEAFGYSF